MENQLEEQLRLALKIYVDVAYGKQPHQSTTEGRMEGLQEELRDVYYADLRLGHPTWDHQKMCVKYRSNGLEFYVDTNDDGYPDTNHEVNQEYRNKIESAWKEAGLPVKKR